ncbi:MAG: methyltransferase domain-containing protein [Anaerolineaceae bacterium]|nr:methyltransferase domain-containing protein [Anaerolineaceae bacterium]
MAQHNPTTNHVAAPHRIDFGDLRRLTPISRAFGFERGQPVDRYYIEQFLAEHAADIHGRVLEIGDDHYTRHFGGDRVQHADVLDLPREDSRATIVGDLQDAEHIPGNVFDCIIFTQTLQYIFWLETAVTSLHRLLRPGGVLLGTFPVISQICRFDMDRWGDYWRFTSASIHRLLSGVFPTDQLTVTAHGNVLTAVSFLHGLSAHELTAEELDFHDPDYQLLITARAVKMKNSAKEVPHDY